MSMMMMLMPVKRRTTAKTIAASVRMYNNIPCKARNILLNPHFSIMVDGQMAGWLGYRALLRRKNAYEIIHMGIKPSLRRHGLASIAVLQVLDLLYSLGGKRAFVRINCKNRPSLGLAKEMGFRRVVKKGRVVFLSRSLDGKAVQLIVELQKRISVAEVSPTPSEQQPNPNGAPWLGFTPARRLEKLNASSGETKTTSAQTE